MFVDGCYCASAETVSPARVMSLSASSLRQAIIQQPRLAFDLFATSSSDIRRLVEQVDQVRTLSVTQRIADFFLRQTAATSGSATFALPYSKTLIASLVGTKPECFSRSLVELRQHGVKVTRDIVTVQDVGDLAVFAGAPSNDEIGRQGVAPHALCVAREAARLRRTAGEGMAQIRELRRAAFAAAHRCRSGPAVWRQLRRQSRSWSVDRGQQGHCPRRRPGRAIHGALQRRGLRRRGADDRPSGRGEFLAKKSAPRSKQAQSKTGLNSRHHLSRRPSARRRSSPQRATGSRRSCATPTSRSIGRRRWGATSCAVFTTTPHARPRNTAPRAAC